MRQGRGDDDYSSLFRQYFPAGRSLKSDQQVSNGEDDQARFAGLEEEKSAGPEAVAETTASGSSASTTAEAEVDQEHTVVTPAADETKGKVFQVEAAHPMATVTESNAQPTVSLELPDKEGRNGEPGGGWGGFWRRTDD